MLNLLFKSQLSDNRSLPTWFQNFSIFCLYGLNCYVFYTTSFVNDNKTIAIDIAQRTIVFSYRGTDSKFPTKRMYRNKWNQNIFDKTYIHSYSNASYYPGSNNISIKTLSIRKHRKYSAYRALSLTAQMSIWMYLLRQFVSVQKSPLLQILDFVIRRLAAVRKIQSLGLVLSSNIIIEKIYDIEALLLWRKHNVFYIKKRYKSCRGLLNMVLPIALLRETERGCGLYRVNSALAIKLRWPLKILKCLAWAFYILFHDGISPKYIVCFLSLK